MKLLLSELLHYIISEHPTGLQNRSILCATKSYSVNLWPASSWHVASKNEKTTNKSPLAFSRKSEAPILRWFLQLDAGWVWLQGISNQNDTSSTCWRCIYWWLQIHFQITIVQNSRENRWRSREKSHQPVCRWPAIGQRLLRLANADSFHAIS